MGSQEQQLLKQKFLSRRLVQLCRDARETTAVMGEAMLAAVAEAKMREAEAETDSDSTERPKKRLVRYSPEEGTANDPLVSDVIKDWVNDWKKAKRRKM